jgi:hypothetical protein
MDSLGIFIMSFDVVMCIVPTTESCVLLAGAVPGGRIC